MSSLEGVRLHAYVCCAAVAQPYMQLPHCWQSLLAMTTDALLLTCQVRLGEKETLESTLKFFDDRIERLSELEFYQVII